jgi:hypothetical protein
VVRSIAEQVDELATRLMIRGASELRGRDFVEVADGLEAVASAATQLAKRWWLRGTSMSQRRISAPLPPLRLWSASL